MARSFFVSFCSISFVRLSRRLIVPPFNRDIPVDLRLFVWCGVCCRTDISSAGYRNLIIIMLPKECCVITMNNVITNWLSRYKSQHTFCVGASNDFRILLFRVTALLLLTRTGTITHIKAKRISFDESCKVIQSHDAMTDEWCWRWLKWSQQYTNMIFSMNSLNNEANKQTRERERETWVLAVGCWVRGMVWRRVCVWPEINSSRSLNSFELNSTVNTYVSVSILKWCCPKRCFVDRGDGRCCAMLHEFKRIVHSTVCVYLVRHSCWCSFLSLFCYLIDHREKSDFMQVRLLCPVFLLVIHMRSAHMNIYN